MRRWYVMGLCLTLHVFGSASCTLRQSPWEGTSQTSALPALALLTAVDVDVLQDRTLITLQSDVALRYTVGREEEPPRLIIDLPDHTIAPGVRPLEVFRGGVSHVRSSAGLEGIGSRVEIGLLPPVTHYLSLPFDSTMLVEVRPSAANRQSTDDHRALSISGNGEALSVRLPPMSPPAVDNPPDEFTSEPRPMAQSMMASLSLPEDKPVYTGQHISLDFQQADLIDVLRLIAEVSGMNIITSPDVSGRVTTRMVNVPWDQALDMILKTHGLGKDQEGTIIRVAPLERLRRERDESLQAKRIIEELEAPITRTVQLSYAQAEDLKENMEKLLTKQGRLDIDRRTNTIIIKDISGTVDEVVELIRQLDSQTKQVAIDTRIVETNRTFLQELGIRWGGLFDKDTGVKFPRRVQLSGRQGPTPVGGNFAVDLPTSAAPALAFGFSLISNSSVIDLELEALERTGRGRIISNPKVVTLDNKEAIIESGDEVPFRTESLQTGPKVEFKDAKITLKVTPHVTPDDFVLLDIDAAKKEVDFSRLVEGNPTITSRQSKTSILVKDGATAVIGGLFKRSSADIRDGVPGISKVPYLGWLFKTEQTRDVNDDLLFFITPRIVRDIQSARGR